MKAQILKAQTLGMIAFVNGKKCAPALDKEVMNMIGSRKVGEKVKGEATTVQILKAWNHGFVSASFESAKQLLSK